MRTVNELLDRYEKKVLPSRAKRTRIDYAYHIRHIRRTFGARLAAQLVKSDIEQFLSVPDGVKGGIQRNRMIGVLSAVLVRAMGWGRVTHNVCSNVRRNPKKSKRRLLTEQEFESARKLATARIRATMDLALLTRQSQGNLLTLRWDQVQDTIILFRDPKLRRLFNGAVGSAYHRLYESVLSIKDEYRARLMI